MDCFASDDETQDEEAPMDPRVARRLARSKQRRARRALRLARAGIVVQLPTLEGWGPRWAA